jgi:hypothetical protein
MLLSGDFVQDIQFGPRFYQPCGMFLQPVGG